MCESCQVANEHFTDGQKDRSRRLQSSTEQGTSPDWGGRPMASSDSSSGSESSS